MASLTYPIRVELVSALERAPMGPLELHEIFPMYSLPYIKGHLRRLEQLGYIEMLQREGRRGSVYQLARRSLFFDQSTLRALGKSDGNHDSTSICITFAERIGEAFDALTFNAIPDSRFMWTVVYLDERRWRIAVKITDALFWYELRARLRAMNRLASSGQPLHVTAGLSCIASPPDSPVVPVIPPMSYRVTSGEDRPDGTVAVDPNLARALSHPVRVRILGELKKQPMSPAQLSEDCDGVPVQAIWKHCLRLEELDCVARVRTRRKGANRNIFRLKPSALFDTPTYRALPKPIRGDVDSVQVSTYVNHLADSILADTIRTRLDSHLSWTGLAYDEEGLAEVIPAIDAVYRFIVQLQRQPQPDRDALFPVTVGLACFGSPARSSLCPDERIGTLYYGDPAEVRDRELRWIEEIVGSGFFPPINRSAFGSIPGLPGS